MIEATDWTFLQSETVDLACDIWEKKFMEIMEKCIPKVTISTKHNLPWMSSTIKAGKRKRNYRRARKTGCPSLWNKYTSLRNQVVNILRQSKREHLRKYQDRGVNSSGRQSSY